MHFLHSLQLVMHFVTQAMHFLQIALRGSKTALRVAFMFLQCLDHKIDSANCASVNNKNDI